MPADPALPRELNSLQNHLAAADLAPPATGGTAAGVRRLFPFLTAVVLGAALICVVTAGSDGVVATASAQSKQQTPLEKARTAVEKARTTVETLINRLRGRDMPEGIVKTNGRIEATQVDVSAKYPGRLATLTVNEGDEVTAGQVVATISSPEAEAQLRSAQAQVLKAKQALAEAVALIAQRKSELETARTDYDRGLFLLKTGNITQQLLDQRRNRSDSADATYVAANAQRDQADSQIKSAVAQVELNQSILVDMVLVSPRSGRVQYRLARAGEVVSAGQRILTILDLNDVYMTIYLPANVAGQLTLGDEARTILDPLPQYVLPNTISFVATEAQFTPKSVETAEEREKLMFRVKLQADPKVLDKYHRYVKTGVRGLAFVRTDPKIPWPEEMAVRLPQ